MINQIDGNQLLMQLRQAALQSSSAVEQKPVENTSQTSFSELLSQSINKVDSIRQQSSELATKFEMGDPNVTLPEVMIAKAKSSVAFEGMVQTRNKVVEAYQEIMRMQV